MKPIIECIRDHIMTFPELKDEPFQETDIIGCSPSISYAFDLHRNCEVQQDIVNITDNELIADDATTVTGYIGNRKLLEIPPYLGGGATTIIDKTAFTESEITGVWIPEGVTEIR